MNEENYFIQTYKEAAFLVRDEVKKYSENSLHTFPSGDFLREETIRFVVDGGKRFRPALAYLVAKYLGADNIIPCVSLEYFHKYLLVHDDIVDQDRIRYAAPTVHAKLEELYTRTERKSLPNVSIPLKDGSQGNAGALHFGNSLGIVSGDLMCADTYMLILHSHIADDKKIALCKLVSAVTEEVVYGWYLQFLLDYLKLSSSDLSEQKVTDSINWVTSTYTIKFPMQFGYILAGKSIPKELDAFAFDLGLLFQTGDDVIGIFGDPEVTQKSNYGDIVQGKKTLPMWFAYCQSNDADKKRLDALVGKEDLSKEEAEEVREIVLRSGGLDRTKEYMKNLREKCVSQVDHIEMPEEMKQFLKGFAIFLEKRDM